MKKILVLVFIIGYSIASFAQNSYEQFEVYNVRNEEDGTTVVYATNGFLCDESVSVKFTTLRNMKADVKLPYKTVVPAGAKAYKLFTLTIKDNTKESQLGYISKHCHGDAFNGKHNNEYVYTIPYQEGSQYTVGQAYGGNFSHYMKDRTHAIDFTMEEGTPVCAAREGVVIAVKDNSNKHGKTIQYQEYGNYITIYHKDGTMADYFHIKKKGSKVRVGSKVKAGEIIALSGNTGWTSGSHLHFQVYSYTEEMEVKSIPTLFLQENDTAIFLIKNKRGYKSVHK